MINKHYQERDLFNKVRWCVLDNSEIRCNLNLIEWLCNVPHYSQKKESNCFFPNADKLFLIQEKYNIQGEEERNIAKEILKEYQKDLVQSYFLGQGCTTDRNLTKITEQEYFLLTLANFLNKHECEKEFNGHQMYITKSYKDRGCWGTFLFNATYELTDYAVVYHKMYYITQIYCLTLRKNPLDTSAALFARAEYTKRVIDVREMDVSRY